MMDGDADRIPDPAIRRSSDVARMFSAIAPTYDLLNHVLSLYVDRHWRTVAVRSLAPRPGGRYLDLCTGTGDLALTLLRRCPATVVGADFASPMLHIAREKAAKRKMPLALVQADALYLPFRDESFDGATVGFGVRNFEDLEAGLREIARVLRPAGKAAILEFSSPRSRFFGALYACYFGGVLPAVGRVVSGRRGAYGYLPATVRRFPDAETLARLMAVAGLAVLSQTALTGGIATLHLAQRPA